MAVSPTPMRLLRIPEPFDHPDFIFEPKIDGFRALAHISSGRCDLVSRNGHTFKSWPHLAAEIRNTIRCRSALLDGELCCLMADGRSDFYPLMFRRGHPCFYAFDVLSLNGRDLRTLPLLERKRRLCEILPAEGSRVLYLDHLAEHGCELFRVACERDLEGVVAKYAQGTYQSDGRATSWLKIKNPAYSQMEGRRELFETRRHPSGDGRGTKIPPSLALI